MAFRLAYLHLTLIHSKRRCQGHAHFFMHIFANISQMMADRADITIAPNITSHVGFRLAYLDLTLTYPMVNFTVVMVSFHPSTYFK